MHHAVTALHAVLPERLNQRKNDALLRIVHLWLKHCRTGKQTMVDCSIEFAFAETSTSVARMKQDQFCSLREFGPPRNLCRA